MFTINKILKTVLLLCLGAFIVSAIACADTTKINVSTDEGKITIAPFDELGLGNHVDKLISEVENEGEVYSPNVRLLNKTDLLFRSDYFVCNVDIEKAHIDWVLDLRDLYGQEPDPAEHALVFYNNNLRSETSADGRFLFYWYDDKPLYLLDLVDKKINMIEISFDYDLEVRSDSIVVSNTEDKKAYEISLDTLSVDPNPDPEVTAEQTEKYPLPSDIAISAEETLYRGSQYFVYYGDAQEFNVADKKSGSSLNTSYSVFENPNSFYSVYIDEEAVIFECDNGFYTIYKNEVRRFTDGKIAYQDIDSCTYDYVYNEDGTNVYPFKVMLNLFDVETAVRMTMELDIKSLV